MRHLARRLAIPVLVLGLLAAPVTAWAESWSMTPEEGATLTVTATAPDGDGTRTVFRDLEGGIAADGILSLSADRAAVEDRKGRLDPAFYGAADDPVALTMRLDGSLLAEMERVSAIREETEGTLTIGGREHPFRATALLLREYDGSARIILPDPFEVALPGGEGGALAVFFSAPFRLDSAPPEDERSPAERLADRVAETTAISGDPAAGEAIVAARCLSCHRVEQPMNALGPHLVGILGRAAGSVEGYPYSGAMADSGLVWDVGTLSRYLADPRGTVPGGKNAYRGLATEGEIADVIAYLDSAGD